MMIPETDLPSQFLEMKLDPELKPLMDRGRSRGLPDMDTIRAIFQCWDHIFANQPFETWRKEMYGPATMNKLDRILDNSTVDTKGADDGV